MGFEMPAMSALSAGKDGKEDRTKVEAQKKETEVWKDIHKYLADKLGLSGRSLEKKKGDAIDYMHAYARSNAVSLEQGFAAWKQGEMIQKMEQIATDVRRSLETYLTDALGLSGEDLEKERVNAMIYISDWADANGEPLDIAFKSWRQGRESNSSV